MRHPDQYSGCEVIVLGMARSGVAVAKLFHEAGAKVTVNDKKTREDCPEADELSALGIRVICGSHPDSLVHPGVSLLVKNPGIPYSVGSVQQAAALGVEIVTEVEVAFHICRAPMIGITGSNGKTTTTTWTHRMLESAGLKPIIAGNIGIALCEAARSAAADNWMVVELSSFQLKGTADFRPRIACLLNVYETHLDYHGTMEDYIGSKAQLFANQTADDTAVLNWDDPECRKLIPRMTASVLPFSAKEQLEFGVYVDTAGMIVYRDRTGTVHDLLPTGCLGVPAAFNVENALAAAAIAITAGAPLPAIISQLEEFRGVEHRLEYVRTLNGIPFYNNSKATNSSATNKALEAFDRPVILIAGGLDRGSDYMDLLPYLRERVKAVVCLGETKHKIGKVAELAGVRDIRLIGAADDAAGDAPQSAARLLDDAVKAAGALASDGDVVLLSPACASWDMFASYEERGRIFKESVHNL